MVKEFTFCGGKIVESSDKECPIYVYVNPDETERKYLIESLNIDEHTLHSSLDSNELARMEIEPDHLALIIKQPKRYTGKDSFLFNVESIGLFMFANRLIILLAEDIPLFYGRQFAKVDSIQDVVLKLIYMSTAHFQGHIKAISMCSDELEQQINSSINNRQLLNMFTLEKSLVFYLEGISSNGRVIERLKTSASKLGLSTTHAEFLDDIAIENAQSYEMAQIYSQVISSLMDARASIISNNLNVMMKNLNAIVIAVAVPSFFAGVGGMSEFSGMIGFETSWKIAYPLFFVAMLLLGLGTFFLIRKIERTWR
jgi:magnesium transporter